MPVDATATPARTPGDGAVPGHPSPVDILRGAAADGDCIGSSGAAGPARVVGVGLGDGVVGGLWFGAGGGARGWPGRPIETVGRVGLHGSGEMRAHFIGVGVRIRAISLLLVVFSRLRRFFVAGFRRTERGFKFLGSCAGAGEEGGVGNSGSKPPVVSWRSWHRSYLAKGVRLSFFVLVVSIQHARCVFQFV